jgi:hypothetical protein
MGSVCNGAEQLFEVARQVSARPASFGNAPDHPYFHHRIAAMGCAHAIERTSIAIVNSQGQNAGDKTYYSNSAF